MAGPDSWMPVYWADLWNDTRDLNAVEQCAYYNLLGSMWVEGGSLPNDNARLQRMSRVTEKEWRAVSATVIAYFECSDGRLYQKRLSEEYAKAMKAYTARSEHMRNVNSKRAQSPHTVTGPRDSHVTHNSQSPSGDAQAKACVGRSPPEEHESFGAFWKAYPSRGKAANPRKPAVKAFNAALKRGADPAELIRLAPTAAPAEKQGTEFVPQATTWLNEDRWRDASPAAAAAGLVTSLTEEAKYAMRAETWAKSPRPPEDRYWHPDWGLPPHKRAPADSLDIPAFLKRTA